MEKKYFKLNELPIGAEVIVENSDWTDEVMVLKKFWYTKCVPTWKWKCESWDYVILKTKASFEQADMNRFIFLWEPENGNKE